MKTMVQKMKTMLFHTLIPAVLAVLLLPMTAFAKGDSCTVAIPVAVSVTGSNVPSDPVYEFVLEAVTPGAPMSELRSIKLKAGEKAAFGPVSYTVPNDYQYKIYQKSAAQDYFTYDNNVYTVTVRVVNGESGGLNAEIWAIKDSSGQMAKTGEIAFTNAYTYTKPGGSGNGGGGSSSSGGGSSSGGPGDGLTVIDDGQTPLSTILPETTIPENLLPLAMLPKTGDTTNVALWMLLMVVSGCGLVLLMAYRKRMD